MKRYIPLAGLIVLLADTLASGQEANVIPFQGQLANQTGQPLSPSNAVTIVFRLYQTPVGGAAFWEESQPNISVNGGRFSILLGSRNPLPGYTNFNSTLYLGLTVDDGDPATADVELRPRQAFVPVISASYAKQAANADKLNGFDWSAIFGTNVPTGNILGSRIAPSTITSSQIAPQTVTAAHIAPSSITAAQIAPTTITSSQIAPETITGDRIANGTIDISNLVQQVAEALVPPGTIVAFGGDTNHIPSGWLLCDGKAILRSGTYSRLYSTIAASWGTGDGSSTFNVPDLRGVFLRGVNGSRNDSYADPNPNSPQRVNLFTGGNFGNQVGSYQGDAFQGHRHDFWIGTYGIQTGQYDNNWLVFAPNFGNKGSDYVRDAANDGVNGSPRTSPETRPKNAYVYYIIKY